MRSVLYGLNKLEVEDTHKLRVLSDLLEGDFKQYIAYALRVHDETGAFPTFEMINDKYSINLNAEDEVKNHSHHLSMFLSGLRDKNIRKKLLELAAKDDLTVSGIQDEIQECDIGIAPPIDMEERLKIKKIYKNIKDNPVGCKFFINTIDEEVMGVSYGKICTIMGFVSHYKTMTAMSVAYGNAQEFGYNFGVIFLEGTKEELYINLLSRHSHTMRPSAPLDSKQIKKGLLNEEDEKFLMEVEEDYEKLKGTITLLDMVDISDGNSVTYHSIKAALDKIPNLDAVIVDYIQLFGDYKVEARRTVPERQNAAVQMFMNLAIHYNSPRGLIVFLLSQTNRTGHTRATKFGGAYTLNALSEINNLERASYYVVSVYTNDVLSASGEMSMQLLKHRGGSKIEDPFTTFVQPACGLVGDVEGYNQVFNEEVLEEGLGDIFEEF